MKIKLDDIEQTGITVNCESSFQFDEGRFESVIFTGQLLPVGDKNDEFFFTGNIKAQAVLACGRCLEDVSLSLGGKVDIRILKLIGGEFPDELKLADEDASAYIIETDEIDIDEIAEQEALLLLPMKVTCSKPCGSELIQSEETEIEKDEDPRWGALNKLKNN